MRCAAQTAVTITAAAAWAGAVAIMVDGPSPDEPLRLVYFAVLSLAVVATALAVGTALFHWIIRGHDELRNARWVYVAGYRHGLVDAAKRQAGERKARPLRIVND